MRPCARVAELDARVRVMAGPGRYRVEHVKGWRFTLQIRGLKYMSLRRGEQRLPGPLQLNGILNPASNSSSSSCQAVLS